MSAVTSAGARDFILPDLGEGLTEAELIGWKVAVVGAVMTTLAAVGIALVGRYGLRQPPRELAGVLAGSQTQPAVLAFANERTGFDTRVGLGYALVYPAAMIAKILIAQMLAGLPG